MANSRRGDVRHVANAARGPACASTGATCAPPRDAHHLRRLVRALTSPSPSPRGRATPAATCGDTRSWKTTIAVVVEVGRACRARRGVGASPSWSPSMKANDHRAPDSPRRIDGVQARFRNEDRRRATACPAHHLDRIRAANPHPQARARTTWSGARPEAMRWAVDQPRHAPISMPLRPAKRRALENRIAASSRLMKPTIGFHDFT